MRLLVVEDEQSLREDITKKLQHSGYEVDACGDGETASEYLAVEYYDLVLLDLNLPKIDGMTLLRNFRKENQETPVLITYDTKSRIATVDGVAINLTRKETGVLEYLMLHQGRPISQEELIEHVWDSSVDSFSNSIRVHISALRKKLRAVLGYDPIRNRIGEGYEIEGESK